MKYFSTNSDDAYSSVSASNRRLVRGFIKYLKSKQRRDSSIKVYTNDLRAFMVWNMNYNDNKDFIKITADDFLRFQQAGLQDWKWSFARLHEVESVLSSLSNYIETEGIYDGYVNIIKSVRKKRTYDSMKRRAYTKKEIAELFDLLITRECYREACAIAIVIFSGMKKEDVLRLQIDAFDHADIYADVFYKISVNGRRYYVLRDKVQSYIDGWLECRKDRNVQGKWLFSDCDEQSQKGVSYAVDSMMKVVMCELNFPLSWEALRLYAKQEFIEADLPYEVVKEIAGISREDMIAMYIGGRKETKRNG